MLHCCSFADDDPSRLVEASSAFVRFAAAGTKVTVVRSSERSNLAIPQRRCNDQRAVFDAFARVAAAQWGHFSRECGCADGAGVVRRFVHCSAPLSLQSASNELAEELAMNRRKKEIYKSRRIPSQTERAAGLFSAERQRERRGADSFPLIKQFDRRHCQLQQSQRMQSHPGTPAELSFNRSILFPPLQARFLLPFAVLVLSLSHAKGRRSFKHTHSFVHLSSLSTQGRECA